ncbi:hypothetical protein ACLB2K_045876 [Fragaria x ananassa]
MESWKQGSGLGKDEQGILEPWKIPEKAGSSCEDSKMAGKTEDKGARKSEDKVPEKAEVKAAQKIEDDNQ